MMILASKDLWEVEGRFHLMATDTFLFMSAVVKGIVG